MNVEDYRPDLPIDDWLRVRTFVLAVVKDVAQHVPYPLASVTNAVASHVDWCVNVAGMPQERDSLFRWDVIAYAVDNMPTTSPSTKGRRRSLLLRVGERLGAVKAPPVMPPLPAAPPSQPYSPAELVEISLWAEYQNSESRRLSALALASLGLGAGLPARDLCAVRGVDVSPDGEFVSMEGTRPRTVRVTDAWAPTLKEVREHAEDPEAFLFRPRSRWHSNKVTVFIDRSSGLGVKPVTHRLRATWIVERLTEGMPMQELIYSAGVVSMDALVRYEKFLPPFTPEHTWP